MHQKLSNGLEGNILLKKLVLSNLPLALAPSQWCLQCLECLPASSPSSSLSSSPSSSFWSITIIIILINSILVFSLFLIWKYVQGELSKTKPTHFLLILNLKSNMLLIYWIWIWNPIYCRYIWFIFISKICLLFLWYIWLMSHRYLYPTYFWCIWLISNMFEYISIWQILKKKPTCFLLWKFELSLRRLSA